MLTNKKILIGVTASIAAYKIANLIRLLTANGATVKVVMTKQAQDFVTPLTLQTLCKNEVLTDITNGNQWANHVELGRWADVMLIAPLSCNTLAKLASGLCDNLLMAVYLSATCPVIVAPAMDEDMCNHPTTRKNLETITTNGNMVIASQYGELASGLIGYGRMAEPVDMLQYLNSYFNPVVPLLNKKVLITAGPTHEALDPIRYITNNSSGIMGVAIAHAAKAMGAIVTLVLGPTTIKHNLLGLQVFNVTTARQMYDATTTAFEDADIAILSAAVADYTAINASTQKIKKDNEDGLTLQLTKTKDILKQLGTIKKKDQIVVGFALETTNGEEYAQKKLVQKKADLIILNMHNNSNQAFGVTTNAITIIGHNGYTKVYPLTSKDKIAIHICNEILQLLK